MFAGLDAGPASRIVASTGERTDMSGFTWRPCLYGQKWPELFAQLPDDRSRHNVSQTLADSRLEGKVHTREDVSDFIDVELGRMSPEESIARGMQRYRAQRGASA